jgi:elongation factor 1-beta
LLTDANAVLRVHSFKMADVIVKLKVMPSDPGADLLKIQKACEVEIKKFGAKVIHSVKQEPVAFGLKAVVIIFLIDEKISNMDVLEAAIKKIHEVQSAEIIDVRRALG